jgi:hypothetical protein
MNYKESDFKIDSRGVKIKSLYTPLFIYVLFCFVFMGVLFKFNDQTAKVTYYLLSFVVLSAFYTFLAIIFNPKIAFKDISHIAVMSFETGSDKLKFKGTGSPWNFFPSGLNKSKAQKIFLIHRAGKKIVIGFSPENHTEVESIFMESGVQIERQSNK